MKLDELKFCAEKKQQLMQNTEYLTKLNEQVENSFKKHLAFALYKERIWNRIYGLKIQSKQEEQPVEIFKNTDFLWKLSKLFGETDELFIEKEMIKHIELKKEKTFEIECRSNISTNIYRRIKKLRGSALK